MTPAPAHARTNRRVATPRVALPLRAAGATVLGALLAVGLAASPAAAEPPQKLTDEIVDTAGALGSRTADVRQAQQDLTAANGMHLYVVFVKNFDGEKGVDWADKTAKESGLGAKDLVLAVALDDHKYSLAVDNEGPISIADQTKIRDDTLQPKLVEKDWAGAAIDTAKALQDTKTGSASGSGSDAAGSSGSSGSSPLTWLLLGLAVIGGILLFRSLRARKRTAAPAGTAGPGGGPGGPGAPVQVDIATLDRRASAALVSLDDELRASEQELGFAQAQFGTDQTQAFAAVLRDAKDAALKAFGLRQRLDDAEPETPDEQRAMIEQILALTAHAHDALHEQTEAFDALRDLQARAPELLEETDRRAVEVSARIAAARDGLERLRATYPATSLVSVATNPEHATALLAAARESVARGREAIAAEDRGTAVDAGRTAEHAVAQAVSLLDAVDHAGEALAGASAAIAAGIASLGSDLVDVERLAPGDPAVRAAATTAAAARDAALAAGPQSDPLELLRALRTTEAALDKALEPSRDEAERAERVRTQLINALGPMRSRIRGVAAYVDTRRGAVGPEARTRLAEAQRLLDEAESLAGADPSRGLQAAERADELGGQAQYLAQQDVEEFERERGGRGQGGGFGGRGNAGSLILGGILID
ncbi:TPM domain-containing protein, partial [Pengzhenrongella sp.]|uniref:TPM domain-containing protein n=1 Tax=Pengzhenrongella sp. TaxID=2888820 RepID=UPI002F94020D